MFRRPLWVFMVVSGLVAGTTASAQAQNDAEPATITVTQVADSVTEQVGPPDISSDPVSGRSLVVYNYRHDDPDGTVSFEVRARMVGGTPGVMSPEVRIDTQLGSTGLDHFEPPIAAWNETDEEWLVVWSRIADPTTGGGAIYSQRVDSDGTLIGSNVAVARSLAGPTGAAGIDILDDIEQVRADWSPTRQVYMVTFKAAALDAGNEQEQRIRATLVGRDGQWVLGGPAFDVSGEEANDGVTMAYSKTSDKWFIAWAAEADLLPGGRILSAIALASGEYSIVITGPPIEISAEGFGLGGAPEAAWDSTRDQFLVVWRANLGNAMGGRVYMASVATGGYVFPKTQMLAPDGGNFPYRVRVAYQPTTDEFLAVYHVNSPAGASLRTFSLSGDLKTVTPSSVLDDSAVQRARPIVATGGGCVRYVWFDGVPGGGPGVEPSNTSIQIYLSCGWCFPIPSGSASFADVVPNAFHDTPVGWLVQEKITFGTTPTTFSPDLAITRGQMAVFLWRQAGKPEGSLGSSQFGDVVKGAFYDQAVGWMVENSITTGMTPSTFEPDAFINRAQAATFLWRRAGRPSAQAGSVTFEDVTPGTFYDIAVGWMAARKITTGLTATTFAPALAVNRGQLAAFLYREADPDTCPMNA